jgi:hypothetical protein
LSFGISGGLIQSQLDETSFTVGDFDPIIDGTVVQRTPILMSYNYLLHSTTFKNAIEEEEIFIRNMKDNLRKYLLSAGYVFGDSDRILFEPSLLFQLVDKTKRKSIDINIKLTKHASEKFGELFLIEEVLMVPIY